VSAKGTQELAGLGLSASEVEQEMTAFEGQKEKGTFVDLPRPEEVPAKDFAVTTGGSSDEEVVEEDDAEDDEEDDDEMGEAEEEDKEMEEGEEWEERDNEEDKDYEGMEE
jgi:hypothetical protein